jgi:hypothetical protein
MAKVTDANARWREVRDVVVATEDTRAAFESPFFALRHVIRAFQLMGIFNASMSADCCSFENRPWRVLYALALNVAFLALPCAVNVVWLNMHEIAWSDVVRWLRTAFTPTDFMALAGILGLLQVGNHAPLVSQLLMRTRRKE